MSAVPYNEPAFPVIGAPGALEDFPGMTLRDYFAAQALPVVASASHERGEAFLRLKHYANAAADAYSMADAMLLARTSKAEAASAPGSDK